jgi:peptide/nickel transport system substrate-binding protein
MTENENQQPTQFHRQEYLNYHFEPRLSVTTFLSALLALGLLIACAPAPVPRADAPGALTPRTTPTRATTVVSSAPAPTPTIAGPEGGAISIGVIGATTLEMNVMPELVQDALFDSLLRINPANGALEPSLAESFQISSDNLTMTFRLRPGIKWHDGAPLTADDVVATIREFSAADFRGRPITDFTNFVRATAIDPQTVQLTFSDAYCPALASIGTLKILPRAVVSSANFPKLTPAQMIGTGALKYVSSNGEQFILQRNAAYYRGAPHIDDWTIRVFNDAERAAMRAAFAAKQIDVMTGAPGEFTALKKIPDANVLAVDANEFIALMFNFDNAALNDPRVRQALAYAIDRNVLAKDVENQVTLIDTSALPGFWSTPGNLPRYTSDPTKAKQLLADAGWRDNGDGVLRQNNRPLQLELYTQADDPLLEPFAFRIREMFAAIGIQTILQLDDRSGWITRAFTHRFDLLLLSRKIPLDPDQRWYWKSDQNEKNSGFNFGSYVNRNVDAFFQAGQRVAACETGARAKIYGDVFRTLVSDAPVAFLFAPKKYLVARERVLNLVPSSFAGEFGNLIEWRVKP